MITRKKTSSRTTIAITLYLISLLLSLFILRIQKAESYVWVARHTIPQGVKISQNDVYKSKVAIGNLIHAYVDAEDSLVGLISSRTIAAEEIISKKAVSRNSHNQEMRTVSLKLQSSDIPFGTLTGSHVAIYKVVDIQPGQSAVPIERVAPDISITYIEERENNFSGLIKTSFLVNQDEAEKIVAASSSGRLVLVLAND